MSLEFLLRFPTWTVDILKIGNTGKYLNHPLLVLNQNLNLLE